MAFNHLVGIIDFHIDGRIIKMGTSHFSQHGKDYVCVPVPTRLSACPSVRLPTCLSICPTAYLPVHLSTCLPTCPSARLPICLPSCLHFYFTVEVFKVQRFIIMMPTACTLLFLWVKKEKQVIESTIPLV